MVDITGVSSSTAAATSSAGKSGATLANNFDDFLTLLTTQLQHQDPTSPMDSNQFTQQLVSFAGVEQQINSNKNLEKLNSLMQVNNVANSSNYLGNQALINGNKGDTDGTGGIKWKYQNTAAAADLTLEVRDARGNLVYSEAGKTGVGLHDFNWDGLENDGTMAPAGNYSLNIKAKDSNDTALSPAIAVQDTIKAVDTTDQANPVFTVGPNEVTQDKICQRIYGQ